MSLRLDLYEIHLIYVYIFAELGVAQERSVPREFRNARTIESLNSESIYVVRVP